MAVAVEGERSLAMTPTWAVSVVCTVIIVISLLLEKGLHHFGEWLSKKQKKAMYEALEKVKSELMILGFISLLLTFGQKYIARLCIPENAANSMLPCHNYESGTTKERRLLVDSLYPSIASTHRMLAGGEAASCYGYDGEIHQVLEAFLSKGKLPFISVTGLHQLHIFIFFLAVVHVAYSASTTALGRAKIRRWKEWEKETTSPTFEFSNDPSRFRFTHETSFVRQHAHFWTRVDPLFYIVCFFRQFFRSVRKVDYLTMRHGFVTVHLSPGAKFNFQKYIKRSLEDDFKVLVGISPVLWASAVFFLLINVQGSYAIFWVTLIPIVILLAVGTKLQAIIAQMAIEIQERHSVVQGIPVVQLSDKHFWFGRPQLVLSLIHFTLFLNAFQITHFFWILYSFGLKSCFHQNLGLAIGRIALGVLVQFLCSYITLPLYALVTQMGSNMKKTVFDEQIATALKKWQQIVKKKAVQHTDGRPATTAPPAHPLQSFMSMGHKTQKVRLGPKRSLYSDHGLSDTEMDTDVSPLTSPNRVVIEHTQTSEEEQVDKSESVVSFSFPKV